LSLGGAGNHKEGRRGGAILHGRGPDIVENETWSAKKKNVKP